MRKFSRGFVGANAILCLVFFAGCGPAEEKIYRVSGTVTFEGKPVGKGLIHFDPDSTKGTDGSAGFANILDGKYDTAQEGLGVKGGWYNVRVNGFDGIEGPDAPFGKALFPEYTGATELPKEDSTFDLNVTRK